MTISYTLFDFRFPSPGSRDVERETGFEPATNSLEGCDSTPELLPHVYSLATAMNHEPFNVNRETRNRSAVSRSTLDVSHLNGGQ